MRNLSKSKLLAFRQCAKRFWLEVYRPELREDSSSTKARFKIGYEVGDIARRLYDPDHSGLRIDAQTEGFASALSRSTALLESSVPIFEAGFAAEGALSFADIMLPVKTGPKRSWRMIEVKSSTSVKDYHHDDIAIQAFVTLAAGVPLESIALAHIDSTWVYPGNKKYQGLLVEQDLTDEAFKRRGEVADWIGRAQTTMQEHSEPQLHTGDHCSDPYECGFLAYCKSREPRPKFPVEWLPRLQSKLLKEFIKANNVTDLRDVPDDYLNEVQRRVKMQTLSETAFFDQERAVAELSHYSLPASFVDFETIQFAVPIWPGTRPYQQIPFQFSHHTLSKAGELSHSEFVDLSGDDPSQPFAESLIAALDQTGPVFVYNASFEAGRIAELAERFPRLNSQLLAITDRIVDLLPIARRCYYHPSQHGSWSIKNVLPAIAPDLRHDELDGVQDGGMAMTAYLEAVHPRTTAQRQDEIRRQLLDYCGLDTRALVRVWQYFTGRDDIRDRALRANTP